MRRDDNIAMKIIRGCVYCLVIMALVGLLNASHTTSNAFSDLYLRKNTERVSYSLLWRFLNANHNKANQSTFIEKLVSQAIREQNSYWIKQAAFRDSLPAILYLAEQSTPPRLKKQWLQRAVDLEHAPSMFELSLYEPTDSNSIKLLERASDLNYKPAIIALAKYWFDRLDFELAEPWLSKASEFDDKSAFIYAQLLWSQGDQELAKRHFERLSERSEIASSYLDVINRFQVNSIDNLTQNGHLRESCSQQLQFVASSLSSMVQAVQFKQRFEQDERMAGLFVCINQPLWISPSELKCELQYMRSSCDLSKLAQQQYQSNYTHLVFFKPFGKAYTYEGLMYLDQADDYSVFIHELAHFAGFVDEYSLSELRAEEICSYRNIPNLIVSESPLEHEQFTHWTNLAESESTSEALDAEIDSQSIVDTQSNSFLAIEPSRTCGKLNLVSYKPSTGITFLEHHDTNNIPPMYLALWRYQLKQFHHQRAFAHHFKRIALSNEQREHWSNIL